MFVNLHSLPYSIGQTLSSNLIGGSAVELTAVAVCAMQSYTLTKTQSFLGVQPICSVYRKKYLEPLLPFQDLGRPYSVRLITSSLITLCLQGGFFKKFLNYFSLNLIHISIIIDSPIQRLRAQVLQFYHQEGKKG